MTGSLSFRRIAVDKLATEQFESAFISGLKHLESEQVKTASMVNTCEPFAKLARAYGIVGEAEATTETEVSPVDAAVNTLRALRG